MTWFWDSFATDLTTWVVVEEMTTCRVCVVWEFGGKNNGNAKAKGKGNDKSEI